MNRLNAYPFLSLLILSLTTACATEAPVWATQQLALDAATQNGPILTEVMNRPVDSKRGEYIEVFNASDSPLDLSGWTIDDGDYPEPLEPFTGPNAQANPTIAPWSYGLIVDSGWTGTGDHELPPNTPVWTTDDSALGNGLAGSDPVALLTPNGQVADAMPVHPTTPQGTAIARQLDGTWQLLPGGDPLVGPFSQPAPPDPIEPAGPTEFAKLHITHPPDNSAMIQAIVDFIDATDQTLDCAFYQLNNPDVVAAILDAVSRGVIVRLVTETHYLHHNSYAATYATLEEAGVALVDDQRSGEAHNKFMAADGIRAWVGSFNPNNKDKYPSADAAIEIQDAGFAAELHAEVDEYMAGLFGMSKTATAKAAHLVDGLDTTLMLSPTDKASNTLVPAIAAAQHSVHILAYAMSANPFGDVLLERGDAGVAIRGVFDWIQAKRSYSEYPRLEAAGHDVRRTPSGLFMHHKLIVIDAGTPDAAIIVGSYNFTGRAEKTNEESVVLIYSPRLATLAMSAFAAAHASASPVDPATSPTLRFTELSDTSATLTNLGETTVDTAGMTLALNTSVTLTLPALTLAPGQALSMALPAAPTELLLLDADGVALDGALPQGLAVPQTLHSGTQWQQTP